MSGSISTDMYAYCNKLSFKVGKKSTVVLF